MTQRPQHLLSRCARAHRVFFVEEPVIDSADPVLDVTERPESVLVIVPHLPSGLSFDESEAAIETLLLRFLAERSVTRYVLWFYTPMAIGFTRAFKPLAIVYDCMDELSAFAGASPELREREAELFDRADLVFTGGQSLYEAKVARHPHVYLFPSSVETEHFAEARTILSERDDQSGIPRPRLGFFGVVDERFDLDLLARAADLRPNWSWIILGPVVKIDPGHLPKNSNIHYLGGKKYDELPSYIAGWDVALLLFAHNDSTRFISPTKTPEYLAAGKPVVSTSIRDVVRPYGEMGLVRIADTPTDLVAAAEAAMQEDAAVRQESVDALLSKMSWDITWARMAALLDDVTASNGAFDAAE